MIIAYADPPYPGQSAKHYSDHPDFAGEVDHRALAYRLATYPGFVLHTSAPALFDVERQLRAAGIDDYRVMVWTKPFAAFKRGVSVAYTWEPVIVRAARKPVIRKGLDVVYRDHIAEPITMKKGLTGVKPEKVCRWAFCMVGADPTDVLADLYPGTGAVTRAWNSWRLDAARVDEAAA